MNGTLMVLYTHTDPDLVDWHHQHALEDLGEISEVECIVGLGRCGQQFSSDGVVDGSGGVDQLGYLWRERGREGGREVAGE